MGLYPLVYPKEEMTRDCLEEDDLDLLEPPSPYFASPLLYLAVLSSISQPR